ncbi:MAG: hypothetical protein R3C62_19035 [Chloroflexota bacterium]
MMRENGRFPSLMPSSVVGSRSAFWGETAVFHPSPRRRVGFGAKRPFFETTDKHGFLSVFIRVHR